MVSNRAFPFDDDLPPIKNRRADDTKMDAFRRFCVEKVGLLLEHLCVSGKWDN